MPQDNDQAAEVVENLLKTAGFSVSQKQIAATQDNNGFSVSVQQNIYDHGVDWMPLDVAMRPIIFSILRALVHRHGAAVGNPRPENLFRAAGTVSIPRRKKRCGTDSSRAGGICAVGSQRRPLCDHSMLAPFRRIRADYLLNIMTGEVVTAESIGETSQTGDEAEAGSGSAADAGSGTGVTANDADADDALPDLEMPEDGTEQSTSNAATQQNATDAAADIWDAEG